MYLIIMILSLTRFYLCAIDHCDFAFKSWHVATFSSSPFSIIPLF
ncbi:unnamed protein product [Brassica rapa subsp. narinosa]